MVLFMAFVVFHDLPGGAYSSGVGLTWMAGIQMLILLSMGWKKWPAWPLGIALLLSRLERQLSTQGNTWPGLAVYKLKASIQWPG